MPNAAELRAAARRHADEVVAPLLGGLGQLPIMYLVNHNSAFLGGGTPPLLKYLVEIIAAIFVVGMLVAVYYRQTNPERYAQLGRYVHEDV